MLYVCMKYTPTWYLRVGCSNSNKYRWRRHDFSKQVVRNLAKFNNSIFCFSNCVKIIHVYASLLGWADIKNYSDIFTFLFVFSSIVYLLMRCANNTFILVDFWLAKSNSGTVWWNKQIIQAYVKLSSTISSGKQTNVLYLSVS